MPKKINKWRWRCPKCDRCYFRPMKSHSCRPYPIENHFRGKEHARELYEHLIARLKETVGPFTTVSPQYGIELLKGSKRRVHRGKDRWKMFKTPEERFLCITVHEKGLELSFAMENIRNPRVYQVFSLGFNKLLDSPVGTNVISKKDIDRQLLGWLKKAYDEASD